MTCLSRTYVQIGITIKHIFVSIFIKFRTELMNIIRKCNLGHEFLFCNVSKKKYKENKYRAKACLSRVMGHHAPNINSCNLYVMWTMSIQDAAF